MLPKRMNAALLRLALVLFAASGLLVLGGCGGGSGAPNNPYAPGPVTPGPLTMLPSAATVYSNTPATLTISGGTPPYSVVSSNSAILPVSLGAGSSTVVLLAANVAAATQVSVTAQDSLGQTTASLITVTPAPIFNTISVKPNSSACGSSSVCSGQTATASVVVTGPTGVGIPNRQVRFDVVTGDYAIQSNNPAMPLVATLTVVSDGNGVAQVILQADVSAVTQPALLRATELTTGNQVTAQFTIVQSTNGAAVLSVIPGSATITGPFNDTCSSGFRVDYFIYGGLPPYFISSTFPNAITLLNQIVGVSGDAFTAITNGTCVNPLVFTIRDSQGLQTTATLLNLLGTLAPPTPPTPPATALDVQPPNQQVVACDGKSVSVLVQGGTAPYNISAQTTTVNGVNVLPVVTPPVLTAPGFVLLTLPNLPNGLATPPNTVYNFVASDSTTPTASTQTFRVTCK